MPVMDERLYEIAATAAALVVDDGVDYGQAKARAIKALGLPSRTPLPDNGLLEEAIREHIALFHADTQPQALVHLRQLALEWMDRLAVFEPLIGGAVWNGTAMPHSDIYLQLFSDDPKAVELLLINQGLSYDVTSVTGLHGQVVDALTLTVTHATLQTHVAIHLLVNDCNAQRGALRADADGRKRRGSAQALRNLMAESASQQP